MSDQPFADHLRSLDEAALTELLRARPDALLPPAPAGYARLAQRLGGEESLSRALRTVNRDQLLVIRALAVLAPATVSAVADLLGAQPAAVAEIVSGLARRGLAYPVGDTVRLPERLEAHCAAELGATRPVARIAKTALADDLRTAATARGVATEGLRKPELAAALAEAMADVRALAAAIRGLPGPLRQRLTQLRLPAFAGYSPYGYTSGHRGRTRPDDPTERLVAAGLVLRVNHRAEVPREVAAAAWLVEQGDLALTGPPRVPPATTDRAAAGRAGVAAALDLVQALAALLDEAGDTPIVALKKGGVGTRERTRLAARLSIPGELLVLLIDLAHAAGLLGATGGGYAPTGGYDAWRAAPPADRWAALAAAWLWLRHAPTSREIDDDRELPPPLPLASGAGFIRRALLAAARPGLGLPGVAAEIDWFFPLHEYADGQQAAKAAAAIREATLLGVVAGDALTDLGEHLLDAATDPSGGAAELARRVGPLLPEASCAVFLQSDLTAVVSGEPSVAAARLLRAAAVRESRDAAAVWRFTPSSVRGALDAGWSAGDLLAGLGELAGREPPQPLAYLINDVARKHGQVRVRAVSCCVVATESLVTEILHTRSLAGLDLSRLAPTVLTSTATPEELLRRLRAAGLCPVAEDASGKVLIESRSPSGDRATTGTPARRGTRASADPSVPGVPPYRPAAAGGAGEAVRRSGLSPDELARRLTEDPDGETGRAGPRPADLTRLAAYNSGLAEAELELLHDALEHQRDVLIGYRDKKGGRTARVITPYRLSGQWLESWCHLRDDERVFNLGGIEAVAPAG